MTPILLLAEARGAAEAQYSSTLIGASGIELIRMLSEARVLTLDAVDQDLIDFYYATTNPRHLIKLWDRHPEVHRTNVFNVHPPHNDLSYFLGPKATAVTGYPTLKVAKSKHFAPGGSFVQSRWASELERLGDEILTHDPNLIVCLGNVSLWALTGQTGITKIRGTTLESTLTVAGYKLLPTYHPAAVLRNYDLRPTVIADLSKAALEGQHSDIRRPHREIWIEPSLDDIAEFISNHICNTNCLLSVDIETVGDRITCIGFATSSNLGIVIPFDDSRSATGSYWTSKIDEARCWHLVKAVLEDPSIPKLFQNGAYDIVFLWRSMKVRVFGAEHDTMLLHHALQPEALKGLGFLGSIYSGEASWKSMRKVKTTKRDD